MSHIENALNKYNAEEYPHIPTTFIEIDNRENIVGVAPTVKFTIQSGTITEVGLNGCQAVDIIHFAKCLVQSLNEAFPCKENSCTITKLEEAIHWQHARTRDRVNRGVEGNNLK